jgi:hypothetical protein
MNSLGTKVDAFVIKKIQTPMHPAGFKRSVPVSQRPQIHASDRAATNIGTRTILRVKNSADYGRRMQ